MAKMNRYDAHLSKMDALRVRLELFLQNCGVKYESNSLIDLVNKLDEVIAVRENKKYVSLETDNKGYVTSYGRLDGVLEASDSEELPQDLLRGYYKYENNKLVLDERKKLEWR
jgi:hypothetical protein